MRAISHWMPILTLTLLACARLYGSEIIPLPDPGNEKFAMAASIKELQEAVTKAADGTTVILKNGQYHETAVLKGRGSKGRPIVVRAEIMGKVELQNQITIEGGHLCLIASFFRTKEV